MKKYVISVIATLLVFVILAQTGLLQPFGIHGVTNLFNKESKQSQSSSSQEVYTDETGVSSRFKSSGDYFEVYENGNWKKVFWTGVNIGAGEPGIFPGELTISYDTYYRWFKYISEMNCNSIRVYTTMRPQFYNALADFNKDAENPLYLFQGVWVNEEDIGRLSDVYAENGKILEGFIDDAVTLVDVIHGNATIKETAGEASGTYTADVSHWFAGWILGIEWDPNLVVNTNTQHPDKAAYDGTYLYTQASTPFEAFLCQVGDEVIKHETETYKFQTPVAFSNWITTDPLTHPNEPHEDEDKTSVNVENVKSRDKFAPGMFVSYHIYPYYPDSLNYQVDYLNNYDENGNIDTYSAYLKDLKLAHTMPILVAEFGVPTSRGLGHKSVMNYDQGRIDETKQGEILADLFESIYDEKYAGGIVFTWQDEWFKRTWNNVMFDIADRRPFWSNIQTTEQCFGLLAFDPGESESVCYVDGDVSEWTGEKAVISNDWGKVYVKSDKRYLYLMLDTDTKNYDFNTDTVYIPIDTIAKQGNTKANSYNLIFNKGADFLIMINGAKNSHIYVDRYYDSFYYYFVKSRMLSDIPLDKDSDKKNSGVFNPMRLCYGYHLTVPGTNEEVSDKAYETGKLQYGNGNPDSKDYTSLTDFCYKNGKVEIRIPWQLLNVMDPSSKQQMDDFYETQTITPKDFENFSFGMGIQKSGSDDKLSIDINGKYDYDSWNTPTYHERLKPGYYVLQKELKKYAEINNK